MKILVANDDGINAKGIKTLVENLKSWGEIYVAAPVEQKSGSGHGITINKKIRATLVDFEGAKMAMAIDGSPADCVKMGIKLYKERGITFDMVFTGINHGSNLGTDTLYSGTVSSALEGAIGGLPSVAMSVGSHSADDFSLAGDLIHKIFPIVVNRLQKGQVLNINVPDIPRKEIKGIKVCRIGERGYENLYKTEKIDDLTEEAIYSGIPLVYDSNDTSIDVIAAQENYITITPLQFDLTDYNMIDNVSKWGINLDGIKGIK